MKVLLDADLPHTLRLHLLEHDVGTVAYLGWNGLKNGDLLRSAEASGFEVFVTGDKNLSYQQNLKARRMAVVVLSAQDWPTISKSLAASALPLIAPPPDRFRTAIADRRANLALLSR